MEVQQYSTSNTDAIEKRDGITFVSTRDCHIYVQCEIEGIKQKTNKKHTNKNKQQDVAWNLGTLALSCQ